MGCAAEAIAGLEPQILGAAAIQLAAVELGLLPPPAPEWATAWHTNDPAGDTSHWAARVPGASVIPPQLRGCCSGANPWLVITTVVG